MDAIWQYTLSRDLDDPTPPGNYLTDARVQAIVAAIPLTQDIAAMAHAFTLVSDVTATASPGVFTRTIRATLTADFMTRHPTPALRTAALSRLFINQFKARGPVHSRNIDENLSFV